MVPSLVSRSARRHVHPGRLLPLYLLLAALALALPRPALDEQVHRPSHAAIVAAINHGRLQSLSGRVLKREPRGLVLRVLLGTRQVAELRRTRYVNADGRPMERGLLHRGDRIIVHGYPAGSALLAIIVQDTSHE